MPSRGEVWLVDLGMIQKVRPALILNRPFNDADRALISVIPHTTALRGSDLEIRFKQEAPELFRVLIHPEPRTDNRR